MHSNATREDSWEFHPMERYEFHLLSMKDLMLQIRLTAEQHERDVLAGELHDYLAQELVAARIKLELLARDIESQEIRTTIDTVLGFVKGALQYTRSMIADLSPEILFEAGIVPATLALAQRMRQHELILQVSENGRSQTLPEDTAVQLYRMIRESLFNVVKHAQTNCAQCRFEWQRHALRVEIRDNGVGFAPAPRFEDRQMHYGLASIAKRMNELNGSFAVTSSPGAGCCVGLTVPYVRSQNHVKAHFGEASSTSLPMPFNIGTGRTTCAQQW